MLIKEKIKTKQMSMKKALGIMAAIAAIAAPSAITVKASDGQTQTQTQKKGMYKTYLRNQRGSMFVKVLEV